MKTIVRKIRQVATGFLCIVVAVLSAQAEGMRDGGAGASWTMDIVDELDALSQQGEQTNPRAASQGGTWGFYADANGEIAGTFHGTSDGAATFCAFQVMGETFPEFKSKCGGLIFR